MVVDTGIYYMPPMREGWRLTRIGYVCDKLSKPISEDSIALICSNKGKVTERPDDVTGKMVSEDHAMQGISKGNIAIHGMDTWHGAIAYSCLDGKITRVVHVCDSTEENRFIVYYLQLLAHLGVYKLISNGVRGNTSDFRSWDKVKDIRISLPPLEVQKAIADYLDKKTSEIDAAVKKAQDIIEKYKSYKQSIITEAVTKGLNPNVILKKSGIEWIGEIPKHWGCTRIETLFTEGVQKNILYEFDHALKFTYGALVPKNEEGDVSELKGTYLAYSIIDEDDIAINGLNLNFDFVSQRVGRCPQRGILTSAYLILKPNDRRYSRYYTYQLKSWDNQKVFHGMGKGVRLTLSFSEVKKMLMPIPPLDEQKAIADYLDDKCTQIDLIVSQKENLISQLQEYKKSIIFEYVTGKKEVQNG